MSKLKTLLFIILMYFLVGKSYAQVSQISITGKVTDMDNNPVESTTVRLKGQTTGAATDKKGVFHMEVPSTGGVLIFSSLGYVTKEITLNRGTVYNVKMQTTFSNLQEVVVIGYGTTTKRDLTGSVGSVSMSDIQKAPVANIDDALAGRIAGVQVTSSDGQPGNSSFITIRGSNSITQDNGPLYVVDGFPIESSINNLLNPNDIESIDVLKDASATAIYGARAANGVVIITTKKGKKSSPVISYDGWAGIQQNIKKYEMLSPYEFVKYQLEFNAAAYTPVFINSEHPTLDSYKNATGVDWQNLLIKDAPMQNHSIAIRGGSEKTQYSVSVSLLDQKGLLLNSGSKRYTGNFTLNQELKPNLNLGLSTYYSSSPSYGELANQQTDGTSGSSTAYIMNNIWGYRPITGTASGDAALMDQGIDPDVSPTSDYRFNPLLRAENTYNKLINNLNLVNAFLEYKFLKGFKLKVSGGLSNNTLRYEKFYNSNTPQGSALTVYGSANGVNGSITNYNYSNWLNENTLTYSGNIKNHKFTVLTGITMQRNSTKSDGVSSILIPNESLGINGLDEGTVNAAVAGESFSTLASYLGRITYSFKGKYLFTASMRFDGSSKFSDGNRWGSFPSASLAWNFIEEKPFKSLLFLSNGKLRGGWGLIGNNRVSDFAYLSSLKINVLSNSASTTSGYPFNNTLVIGAVPSTLGNDQLKWETTAQTDIGLDLGFLKNRIEVTADYYYKKTKDLLLNASLAASTGYGSAFKNIGSVSNQGFEFTLNTRNIVTPNFSWQSNFNISFNRNKILSLNENQPSLTTMVAWDGNYNSAQPYIARPGYPIAMFYGYVFNGIYQKNEFDFNNGVYVLKSGIPGNGNAASSIQPGDIKYKDINGDGVVSSLDQTVIGNPNPKHTGGFSNNFNYKGIDLNIFFQWSYGNDIFNANRLIFDGGNRGLLNLFKTVEDRWTPDNPSNTLYRVKGAGPNVYSSRVIEDGSYLRLKTVSMGYKFSPKLLKQVGVTALRLYCSAQNLYTWTKYSGLNPSVSIRQSALTPGFDWSAYPLARTVVIGLNSTF